MKAFRSVLMRWVATSLALISVLGTALTAELTLGRATFDYPQAKALRNSTPLRMGLGGAPKMGFVGRIGGVAFDSLAKPQDGLTVKSVSLSYDPSKPDGERFTVVLNGQPLKTGLPDWQLLPIIRYADSDSTSCFTLFGELEDKSKEDDLLENDARILNYDSAFKDTLLGLRLFQLDVLLLDDEFALELPKDGPNYVLGLGEKAPQMFSARTRKLAYDQALSRVILGSEPAAGGFDADFQSYVICDQKVDIRFGGKDGTLQITGEPRYYFWNSDQSEVAVRIFIEEAKKIGLMKEGESDEEFQQRLLLEALSNSETKNKEVEEKMEKVGEAVAKRLDALGDDAPGGAKATYLEKFSDEHEKLVPMLSQVNPAVWNAGRATMRYAAFFRYCKASHPAAWQKFYAATSAVDMATVTPTVKTPTVMKLPEEAP